MKTGISKARMLVEHDRPVLRYGGLLMYFPLCSLLSARHSFLTAHDDCLALLSRYQELSVCFRRRAKQDACSDVPVLGSVHELLSAQWLHWGGVCKQRAAWAQTLHEVWQTPLHRPSGQWLWGAAASSVRFLWPTSCPAPATCTFWFIHSNS